MSRFHEYSVVGYRQVESRKLGLRESAPGDDGKAQSGDCDTDHQLSTHGRAPVGGRIVGEVLLGLLELDPRSWFSQDPTWKPTIKPADAVAGCRCPI